MTSMSDLIKKIGTPITHYTSKKSPIRVQGGKSSGSPKTSSLQGKSINKAVRDAETRSKRKKDIRRRTDRSDGHKRTMEQDPLNQLESRTINPRKEGTTYSGRNFLQNKTIRDHMGKLNKRRFDRRKVNI